MLRERGYLSRVCGPKSTEIQFKVHEIDPGLLQNPVGDASGKATDIFIGRGSFGVVHLQTYRRMAVAVKELLPRTQASDVYKEAMVLARFCHPYLPYLFGVITSKLPHRIIMQYHGLGENVTSLTLTDVFCCNDKCYSERTLLLLCFQIAEALRYLHEEVKVLHNDLKCSNVVICDSLLELPMQSTSRNTDIQIVVVDFGKATAVDDGKKYHLNPIERSEYLTRYPHMAPEIIEGITTQTVMSEVYALGGILRRVLDHGTTVDQRVIKEFSNIASRCRSPRYFCRPTAKEVLVAFEKMLK